MTKDGASLAFALLNHYSKLYKDRYGKAPQINKYKEKWAASSILEDYGQDQAFKVMDYYFTLSKEGHPLNYMFNNFDNIQSTMQSNIKDEEIRRQRRKETARLRQEWLDGNA